MEEDVPMTVLRKGVRVLRNLILGIFGFVVLYLVAAFVLSLIPVYTTDRDPAKDITIYIKTNGVHTDLVMPLRSELIDWSQKIKISNTKANDTLAQYIAMGWGDKGFYLDTPQWSDLKAKTAFKAAFYLGTSAMHTTFYNTINEDKDCVAIPISKEEYQQLIDYIQQSFQYDANGDPLLITASTYGNHDSFYEANRKYSLFYTCNTWTNNALKASGQKAALWTPADKGIFWHYE